MSTIDIFLTIINDIVFVKLFRLESSIYNAHAVSAAFMQQLASIIYIVNGEYKIKILLFTTNYVNQTGYKNPPAVTARRVQIGARFYCKMK
jgi:hypothetical protein